MTMVHFDLEEPKPTFFHSPKIEMKLSPSTMALVLWYLDWQQETGEHPPTRFLERRREDCRHCVDN